MLLVLEIFTLCSYCWMLKLSFDGESKRAGGLGTVSVFPVLY